MVVVVSMFCVLQDGYTNPSGDGEYNCNRQLGSSAEGREVEDLLWMGTPSMVRWRLDISGLSYGRRLMEPEMKQ
jgi:hypothetical protein